jgi:hypothetical protein
MLERFMARVGTIGAILILALAVLVVGFGGGVVEHFRLAAAQSEQQGDQSGKQGESKESDNATQSGQKGEQGDQSDNQTGSN